MEEIYARKKYTHGREIHTEELNMEGSDVHRKVHMEESATHPNMKGIYTADGT